MKYYLFGIYDSATQIYDGPFKARSNEEAMRTFMNMAGDPNLPVAQNPEYFSLARLGVYDDNTGVLLSEETGPVHLLQARDCVNSSRPEDAGDET